MKDERRPPERRPQTVSHDPTEPIGRRDEPSVGEIVERCRAVTAACGMTWIHDLVREEVERWAA